MAVTYEHIKRVFDQAEIQLDFCWDVLIDLKHHQIQENDFTNRFIRFQETLATCIYDLQAVRDKIIIEEKKCIAHKNKYLFDWFKKKLQRLSGMKEAIDDVVNIGKALGDAYVFYFYQNDLELLAEHLSHQRVINHASGNGERAELEFVRRIKHIEGQVLDFGFIDD